MSRVLRANDVIVDSTGEAVVLSVRPSLDLVELYEPTTQLRKQDSLRALRYEIATGLKERRSEKTINGTVARAGEKSSALSVFQFRLAVVKKIKAKTAQGKSNRQAILELCGSTIELPTGEVLPMCSQREAYRILSLAECSEASLFPAHDARGNRKPRYDQRVTEIILQLVESLYSVKHSLIRMEKLTELTNHQAHVEGVLPREDKVSRKHVTSVVIENWNPDLDYKRLDPRVAKSLKAVAANRIRPGAPLNRVEMDSCHLPFIAQTEYGTADEIWLMVAIDCETSIPLSWWLMLARPTTEDSFECLERAIYPKEKLLTEMGVKFSVDPYGIMLNLVWDNGSENSRTRTASVTTIGINPIWTEVHSGHRKPFIERYFRSLKEALESLPGCTRFNGKDGARTEEARNDELLWIKQLERWIVRFSFEKWPNAPLDRFITTEYEIDEKLGRTPAERWKNYEEDNVLPTTPSIEEWRALRYLKSKEPRVLHHKTGISFENYDFRGDNLKQLIAQYGPSARVDVFYNPFDYRTIQVPDKHTGKWLELVNSKVTPESPAYPFDVAKKRKKLSKSKHVASPIAQQFDADLNEQILQNSSKKRTRTDARRNAHYITRTDEAVRRAKENPLPPSMPSLPVADTYITDDVIPNFKTHRKPPKVMK